MARNGPRARRREIPIQRSSIFPKTSSPPKPGPLLPCPFPSCGGEALHLDASEGRVRKIFCGKCGVSTRYMPMDEAEKLWNSRGKKEEPVKRSALRPFV